MAEELAITGRMAKTRPNYQKTAAALLERCRAFYQDPKNEKAFQEWKARKDGKNETIKGEKSLYGCA
jgi:hypothetical protein